MIGSWIDVQKFKNLSNINFHLKKNGKLVQSGNSSNMIWKIDELISEVSSYFSIKIGDIMFTGTPEGVGKVSIDDVLEGFLEDQKVFNIKIK